MGPTWVLSAPDGPHVGPMNLPIRVCILNMQRGYFATSVRVYIEGKEYFQLYEQKKLYLYLLCHDYLDDFDIV